MDCLRSRTARFARPASQIAPLQPTGPGTGPSSPLTDVRTRGHQSRRRVDQRDVAAGLREEPLALQLPISTCCEQAQVVPESDKMCLVDPPDHFQAGCEPARAGGRRLHRLRDHPRPYACRWSDSRPSCISCAGRRRMVPMTSLSPGAGSPYAGSGAVRRPAPRSWTPVVADTWPQPGCCLATLHSVIPDRLLVVFVRTSKEDASSIREGS